MSAHGILATRLLELDPALHERLLRSWDEGSRWLDSIGANLGSSNAYSHLRNLEHHLDQIVLDFEKLSVSTYVEPLNALELYLLLSAVLFHDIGRSQQSEDHGRISKEIINHDYAQLGIPSEEIARTLGEICQCHEPSVEQTKGCSSSTKYVKALQSLTTTAIEPYGVVRERFLGALLTLVDKMDASHTRTIPDFLTGDDGVGMIALFRRHIRGVYVDPFARMVRTVIVPREVDEDDSRRDDAKSYGVKVMSEEIERDAGKEFAAAVKKTVEGADWPDDRASRLGELNDRLASECEGRGGDVKDPETALWLQRLRLRSATGVVLQDLFKDAPLLYGMVVLGWLRLEPKEEDKTAAQSLRLDLPRHIETAMVLGDMRKNVEVLRQLQRALAEGGIYLAGWVLERKEHVYDEWGRETAEPLLNKSYLLRTCDKMWELSCQIFGTSRFSYRELASHMGETSVEKTRRAVRRLAIISESLALTRGDDSDRNDACLGAIWAGIHHWEWNVSPRHEACCYVDIQQLTNAIGLLSDINCKVEAADHEHIKP